MTHAVQHSHSLSRVDRDSAPYAVGTSTANDDVRTPDSPLPRSVVTRVTGALDGVTRVVTMLRARGYVVRNLKADIQETLDSEIRATVDLTAGQTDLLLERLRRLAIVVNVRIEDL
ncbi:hypothetical protein ACIRQQ_48880 [Streptomyces fuscichromogenes]|uniref:hypothetical protein n=1 Tax=Streptomyces fuscichromogenes TaxID=1324013 RepID=UPI00381CD0A4